ncbi:hypothetical protein H4S02_010939, partial [Coemansia sp. RSA 2611]
MTLRMIPASRNKAASTLTAAAKPGGAAISSVVAASGTNISPTILSASSISTRERAKTTALAHAAATPDGAPALASGIQHHPTLQQLSRERKQLPRHQARAQQKQPRQIDADDGDTETDNDVDFDTDRKRKSTTIKDAPKATTNAAAAATAADVSVSTPSQPQQQEADLVAFATAQEADTAAAATEVPVPTLSSDAAPEMRNAESSSKPTQQSQAGVPATTKNDQSDSGVLVDPPLQVESIEQSDVSHDAIQAANHTNSALSFQSITDSLFAQLNAKVSTPPTSNLPAFSGAGGSSGAAVFDSHVGGPRNPSGYPVSAVDPLLFPPMVMGSNDVSSIGYGRMDAAPQFNAFGGQPNAQWGRLGMAPGGYAPTSLSSVYGGPPALGPPPMGLLGEAPPPVGSFGAFSRQRSRWDFVHADEASAQA